VLLPESPAPRSGLRARSQPRRSDDRDAYAYDRDYRYHSYYRPDNGFVCQPGTWFRGEDGRNHLCQ
jgi:hypothetical protein